MRTLLVNPTLKGMAPHTREGRCMQKSSAWSANWPPIGLLVLAAIAEKFGPTMVIDGNTDPIVDEEFVQSVKDFQCDVLVLSSGFPSIKEDMHVAELAKRGMPGLKTVSYGIFFTLLGEKAMLNNDCLDFAMIGEPEGTFGELLAALSGSAEDVRHIAGLMHRQNGSVITNKQREVIPDLDSLPIPARQYIDNASYRLPFNNRVFTMVNTARGCNQRCIYCTAPAYYGRRIRRHSIDYLIEEIALCRKEFGINDFFFWEESFTQDKEFVLTFCERLLAERLDISWMATTRAGSVDEQRLLAMKQAGCSLLAMGLESGSQKILDAARKNQSIAEVRSAVLKCKQVGIETVGHFVFGLPNESRATAKETFSFIKDLKLDYIQAFCAVPYPNTEFGEMAAKLGWVTTSDWTKYDLGGGSIVSTPQLRAEQITKYRRRALLSFYLSPRFLARNMVRIARFGAVVRFLNWMRGSGGRSGVRVARGGPAA